MARAEAWLILAAALPLAARAQVPELSLFGELRPTWQVLSGSRSLAHWYDPLARYSIVGFRFVLEPGYRAYVAQRLEKVDSTGDPESIDEYYVEDRGLWRVGKQYLPFGRRAVVRESVLAARGDTRLVFDGLPIAIAACDGGAGRNRGIVGRIGRELGVSFAVGKHFAIQPSALAIVRDPTAAPGRGRGYRLMLGADYSIPLGPTTLTAEWVSLRDGETDRDPRLDVSELRLRSRTRGTRYVVNASWARSWSERSDFYRVEVELDADQRVAYVPALRFRGTEFRDFSLTAVVRF